jgi:4-amino-4-deoxy-L-arabinose transferase-like glycosyltransferase
MAQLSTAPKPRNLRFVAAVASLLLVLALELIVPARRQSATFDEGCHILAGYSYWTRGDFAINPEHPPLVKLLAAVPLLSMPLRYSPPTPMSFKAACFVGGRQFLYSNNADAVLFRARMAAATLTILAALVVFTAAYEMFSPAVGLLALLLFVFEPNLIAHGSLVTTDMGMNLFLFATVYAFYRYLRKPSLARLLVTALCAGLALAAKHSAILLLPILLALALSEIALNHPDPKLASGEKPADQRKRLKCALQLAASLAAIGALAVAILWASYGFHFSMRPQGPPTIPTFSQYVASMHHPRTERALTTLAHYRLLPEAYLFGLADLVVTPQRFWSFLLGKVYLGGRWFYFPAAFVIKSTIGFLLLLFLLPVAIAVEHARPRRELLFLAIPAAVYFLAAMHSDFNIGIRHILPLYPFLVILAAYAAWVLGRSRKLQLSLVSALVLFHVVSSARAFPNYLPYSNEAWGGPANTYKFLTDSNVDWGQQLKLVKKYLDERGIQDCWFAYSASLAADPGYYQIPCKPLPQRLGAPLENLPPRISGTVLISATELSPATWGPDDLNPYAKFRALRPDAEIADGIFVFHGEFDVPLLAAMAHTQAAERCLASSRLANGLSANEISSANQAVQALAEAQAAVSLAPGDVGSQAALGDALTALGRPDEARADYQRALTLAETHYPEFQSDWLPALQRKLQ